jgi:hypothetical protein
MNLVAEEIKKGYVMRILICVKQREPTSVYRLFIGLLILEIAVFKLKRDRDVINVANS